MVERLHWDELADRRFDGERARELVASLVAAGDRDHRQDIVHEVARRLIEEFGLWTEGWHWSSNEPGSGGPVGSWCCADHSMLREDEAPDASVDRIMTALVEWREYLDGLSRHYAELREDCRELPRDRHVERAAARLLPAVVTQTQAHDAWYETFATVLRWYLESAGLEGFEQELRRVISGRFRSWVAPTEEVAAAACQELGRVSLAPLVLRDALAEWLKIRPVAFNHIQPKEVRAGGRDAHRDFIEGPEHERDPFRAECMLAALEACRLDARGRGPLTMERLAHWQSLVLAEPDPGFRETWAYAKEGREAYGTDYLDRFEKCLADATGPDPLPVRAARVYLDVCFFHPFNDGNARSARLALDFVLTRGGRSLRAAEMLFALARSADDQDGAWHLAHIVDHLS